MIRAIVALLTLSFVLMPEDARAQERSASDPDLTRFTVSVQRGPAVGGAAGDLEQAMTQNGFDVTSPPGCFLVICNERPIGHPYSSTGSWGTVVAIKYRFERFVAAEFVFGSGDTGLTSGYAGDFTHLILRHSVTTAAALAVLDEGTLHVGLGPAVYSTRAARRSGSSGRSKTKLGLLADAGAQFPSASRFFVDLRLQYRLVGKAEIGPFEVGLADSATLPASEVTFSHGYVGVGLGIRF